MCSGDDNDWVAADDGGTTPIKGIGRVVDCALPRQLVLGRFFTPNNSPCGLSTRWNKIFKVIDNKRPMLQMLSMCFIPVVLLILPTQQGAWVVGATVVEYWGYWSYKNLRRADCFAYINNTTFISDGNYKELYPPSLKAWRVLNEIGWAWQPPGGGVQVPPADHAAPVALHRSVLGADAHSGAGVHGGNIPEPWNVTGCDVKFRT